MRGWRALFVDTWKSSGIIPRGDRAPAQPYYFAGISASQSLTVRISYRNGAMKAAYTIAVYLLKGKI